MVHCNEIVALVASQPEGRSWSQAVRRRFIAHLKECDECAREYAIMAAVCESAATDEGSSRVLGPHGGAAGYWGTAKGKWTLGAVGTLAAAACVALVLLLPVGTVEQGLVSNMQVAFRPGREVLGDPNARIDGFSVAIELLRNSYVILAVRDESGNVEEIQGEGEASVATLLSGSKTIPGEGAYAIRDSSGRLRTHVIIMACEKRVTDTAWHSRPREFVKSGPELAAGMERVRKDLAERFGCDVRVAPIPHDQR